MKGVEEDAVTIAAVAAAPTAGAEAADPVGATLPDDGFDDVLASATTDGTTTADATSDGTTTGGATSGGPSAHRLPTLTLGEMVTAIVDGPSPEALGAGHSAGDVATAARTSDAWGVSAERPDIATSGPGAAVLDAGEDYLGVPYKWGGTDADIGFDCSGFVQQVFADLGIDLPRVSADQARAGEPVAGGLDEAQPGDLVFWRGGDSRPNHIGIYAGEGRMLVAPSSGDVVRYQEITRTPDAVRRVI